MALRTEVNSAAHATAQPSESLMDVCLV